MHLIYTQNLFMPFGYTPYRRHLGTLKRVRIPSQGIGREMPPALRRANLRHAKNAIASAIPMPEA